MKTLDLGKYYSERLGENQENENLLKPFEPRQIYETKEKTKEYNERFNSECITINKK